MKTEEDVEKIIHEYAIILEIGSDTATRLPNNFLPYPLEEIKKAIKIAIIFEKDLNQIKALKAAYVRLAIFIPLEEALIVFRFEKYALEKYELHKKVLPDKVQNPEDQLLQKKYSEIQKKVAKKMEELLNEIK